MGCFVHPWAFSCAVRKELPRDACSAPAQGSCEGGSTAPASPAGAQAHAARARRGGSGFGRLYGGPRVGGGAAPPAPAGGPRFPPHPHSPAAAPPPPPPPPAPARRGGGGP